MRARSWVTTRRRALALTLAMLLGVGEATAHAQASPLVPAEQQQPVGAATPAPAVRWPVDVSLVAPLQLSGSRKVQISGLRISLIDGRAHSVRGLDLGRAAPPCHWPGVFGAFLALSGLMTTPFGGILWASGEGHRRVRLTFGPGPGTFGLAVGGRY
jgi:hypothetical protein